MNKSLLFSLLRGVAAMLIAHGVGDLIFNDRYLEWDLLMYVAIGLVIGYIVYRSNKRFKGQKL